MDEIQRKNRKIVWYCVFAAITIILCYLFVVLYFFYFSPYNIAMKTSIWPFLSKKSLGEIYRDSMVEISWTYEGGLAPVEMKVAGVNVREDGFIIAPYNDLRGCEESGVKIMTNTGKTFEGRLIFGDMDYDLAILKCENISGKNKIKIPYVRIGSSLNLGEDLIAVSSPLEKKNVWTNCEVLSEDAITTYSSFDLDGDYVYDYDIGYNAVDYVLHNCYGVSVDADFSGGAFFDTSGNVLGLSNGGKLAGEQGEYECDLLIPVDVIEKIFDKVVSANKKGQVKTFDAANIFKGLDNTELSCHMMESNKEGSSEENQNGFYFDGEWREYDDALRTFHTEDLDGVILVEDVDAGGALIEKGCVINEIKYRGKSTTIWNKLDLVNLMYQVEDGEIDVIYHSPFNVEEVQSVTIQIGGNV